MKNEVEAMKLSLRILALVTVIGLAGCNATTGGSDGFASDESRPSAEATACLAGDQSIESESMCLHDDAACYPIADGSWCTGPRVASCPMGSNPLPAELPCPEKARCFAQSESLQCVIGG